LLLFTLGQMNIINEYLSFDLATPEFSQVRDPAPSESVSTNKDDSKED
jgi:hypothetical protein